MTPDDLHTSFEANLEELPGSASVRAERQAALAEFLGHGFPTRKTEDWRYTNIAPIVEGQFELFAPSQPVDDAAIAALLRDAGVDNDDAVLLFVDGSLVADRTAAWKADDDVSVLALADSLERQSVAADATTLAGYPLAALNVAFARDGMHLQAAAGAAPSTPLHIVLANVATETQAVQPQLVIDMGPHASAVVVVHLMSAASNVSWINLLTRITLAEGSRLEIRRLQHYGDGTVHTDLTSASIAKDASLRLTSVDLGGRLVRNDVRVRLEDNGASCDLAGLVAAGAGQHIDNHIAVDHVASHSQSTQQYRAIVGDRGRAVFNGKVVVHRGTAGVSAMQSSDNLLLADSGEIDTKPELEIYADDVKCSHGATIGEIDEAELFYLRTRGIDAVTARGLLTLGFAEKTLERLPASGARAAIAAKFGLTLPSDDRWNVAL